MVIRCRAQSKRRNERSRDGFLVRASLCLTTTRCDELAWARAGGDEIRCTSGTRAGGMTTVAAAESASFGGGGAWFTAIGSVDPEKAKPASAEQRTHAAAAIGTTRLRGFWGVGPTGVIART